MSEQKANSAYHINVNGRDLDGNRGDSRQVQENLATRLRGGDKEAASELVDMYYEQIYLYMRRLGHDPQISEDLTQESFFSAWRHIGQLRDGKSLNGWLYRIAGNVSRLFWRKHKHISAIEDIKLPDADKAVSEQVNHQEELERLNSAVSKLPRKLRQTIVLHYMQQLTIAEAAQAADIREGTFKSRLNRALKILRKQDI